MRAPANCRLIGRWRIVEADIWDRGYLDLCGPATITITDANGRGEIAFGALQAGLDIEYSRAIRSASPGKASTKWTKSRATDPPNCSTTALSRSNSPTTTATKPSSKPNGILLQQPARSVLILESLSNMVALPSPPAAAQRPVDRVPAYISDGRARASGLAPAAVASLHDRDTPNFSSRPWLRALMTRHHAGLTTISAGLGRSR